MFKLLFTINLMADHCGGVSLYSNLAAISYILKAFTMRRENNVLTWHHSACGTWCDYDRSGSRRGQSVECQVRAVWPAHASPEEDKQIFAPLEQVSLKQQCLHYCSLPLLAERSPYVFHSPKNSQAWISLGISVEANTCTNPRLQELS